MNKSRKIKVYSTLGCHLCDLALDIIRNSSNISKLEIEVVDIADDSGLVERYGTRIPVVFDNISQVEISWPFSDEMFDDWCSALP